MNLVPGSPWWLIAILLLALAAAAIEDVVRLRISNATCIVVLVAALVAMGFHGFPVSLWQNALVFAVILVAGTAAFSAGWVGGGDVKLLAALGLWVDLRTASGLLAAVFMAGGLVSLAFIFGRRLVRRRRPSIPKMGQVPYALAIVGGALFIFAIQINSRPANPYLDHLRALQAAEHR